MKIAPEKIHKILIINLAFIGDVLLSTAVSRALREHYPDAQIHMLVLPVAAGIAKAIPYVDEALIYDKRGRHKSLPGFYSLIKTIRRNQYDLAVCTNFALRGATVAWLSGIPYRAGYDAQQAQWFLSHIASSKRDEDRHEAEKYLDVLKPLEISTLDNSLALEVSEQSKQYGKTILKKAAGKPLVLLCPYGSYPRKSLSDEKYSTLIRLLKEPYYCCLIGGKAEASRLQALQVATDLPREQVLAGTADLVELAYLIAEAKVLITVDTGPLHIAQAVTTPVVAFFGPTDPKGWGPRGPQDVVFYDPVPCSPCWGKGECLAQVCMKSIEVKAIAEAVHHIVEVN